MSDKEEICNTEIVVLEEIYEKKFNLKKKSYPQQFVLNLEAFNSAKANIKIKCSLKFGYTLDYPDEKPEFTICEHINLVEEQLNEIKGLFDTTSANSIGCMMIYDISSNIQDYLNNQAEHCYAIGVEKAEQERIKKEKEADAKFYGTKVTIESFNNWHKKFVEEMKSMRTAEEIADDELESETLKRITGKELFLKDNRFDDSEIQFFKDGGEAVEIDEKLFTDLSDLDLDEHEFETEDLNEV